MPISIRDRRQRLLNARRSRVVQRDSHPSQRLIRTRRRGTTTVINIPEQGVTDHAVGDETEVDRLIVLTLGKRHGAVGTVGILLRIRK